MLEERLFRTELMLGEKGIEKLKNSFVVIVGLGAVGSYATEAIARSGVGRIRVVDFDTVCATNINRQLYALSSTVGMEKSELAKARILDINPDCNVEATNCFVHVDTMDAVLAGNPDIVVDAIDSLNPKVELLAALREKEIPVISSMGAALRTDPKHIKISKLKKVHGCPLARMVRKRLRRRDIDINFKCVHSTETPYNQAITLGDIKDNQVQRDKLGRARNVLGSLPTITGIFGLTIANEVIRTLTDDFCRD